MEKDKNRYITEELYNSSIRTVKNIKIEKFNILLQDSYSQLAKIPNKEEIHIYDLGKNLKKTSKQTIIYINNHINKTGINPLRGREQGSIQFYDITEIYQQKKVHYAMAWSVSFGWRELEEVYIWTTFVKVQMYSCLYR